jgi:serine protease Do
MQSKLNDRMVTVTLLSALVFAFMPRAAKASQPDESIFRLGGTSAWLGVVLRDVTTADVKTQHLSGDYGAMIVSVEDHSPAAKAGLQSGDVLVEFAGREIWSVAQLERWVADTPVGRTVELKYFREGSLKFVNVTLESHSHEFRMPPINIPPIHVPDFSQFYRYWTHPRLGISGQTLTPQLAHYFGVEQANGVLVTEVESGSPAEKAGLKAGDCIIRFGSKAIGGMDDLQNAVSNATEGHAVTLTIVRNRVRMSLTVSLPAQHNEMSWRIGGVSRT